LKRVILEQIKAKSKYMKADMKRQDRADELLLLERPRRHNEVVGEGNAEMLPRNIPIFENRQRKRKLK